MVFLFATNTMLLFYQKSKDDLLTKNRIEDDISILLKKSDIILENMVFLLKEKLKKIKEFTQSNTRRENLCD